VPVVDGDGVADDPASSDAWEAGGRARVEGLEEETTGLGNE
jgi:hypothetical protein